MNGDWQPPDQHLSDRQPADQPPPGPGGELRRPPGPPPGLPRYTPPAPALGIISLLWGGIGALAAFFPVLRLPGAALGLLGALLGVVTIAVKVLGGKLFAAGGVVLGVASVAIAVLLFLQSIGGQNAIVPPPSAGPAGVGTAVPLDEPTEVELAVVGDGVEVASVAYRIDSRSRKAGTVDESFVRLPYTRKVKLGEAPLSVWLIAGRSAEQGTLVCRITANGLVLQEKRVTVDDLASECKAEWWTP
ncbi:hypothetical protein GCM10009733_084280 [Nonomuraea maheshkhaliensis]|uniref:DUF4190 domain-containing protein n=1 Tax=Nonomuraea maheshkhaliensis TaxID=419590 RepID=A0ABP4SLY4_9ACTN